MDRDPVFFMYPSLTQLHLTSPVAWNRFSCMKQFPGIITRHHCSRKILHCQSFAVMIATMRTRRDGLYTASHWEKNWVCILIRINTWVHWETKCTGLSVSLLT